MSNKIKIIFILVALAIVFSVYYLGLKNEHKAASVVNLNNELSLKEAINLGLDRAKKWNNDAVLMNITSVDEEMGGTGGETGGETGKRYKWTLNFMVPGKDKHLLVGISNGKVSIDQEVIGPSNVKPIELDDIKFDSPTLLKIAKNKYSLRKGEDWAKGYHFSLDTIEDNPTVTIFGIDKDNLFTRINFDPRSSKIMGAIHKVPDGGGLVTYHLGTNTLKVVKKGMAVKGITVGNDSLVAWGDRKPRVFNSKVQPFIELSNNHGESWTTLNFNQNIFKAWFNSHNELYVATETELWSNVTFKNKMKRILKSKIDNIDYSQNNNIAVLSNNYIYTTINNGNHWDKTIVPEPILWHQISDSGNLILLTNNRKILLKNGDKWDILKTPTNEGEPSDIKLIGNNLFLILNDLLWVHNLKSDSWNKIQVNDHISKLIKKKNNLFGISREGTVYLIKFGGDANELIPERLFEAKDRNVTDLEVTQNELLITTIPNYNWAFIN